MVGVDGRQGGRKGEGGREEGDRAKPGTASYI